MFDPFGFCNMHFDHKIYLFNTLIPDFERKLLGKKKGMREKVVGLPYFDNKKVNLSVNWFFLLRGVLLVWFRTFILPEKSISNFERKKFF